jgi:hypothetical protein
MNLYHKKLFTPDLKTNIRGFKIIFWSLIAVSIVFLIGYFFYLPNKISKFDEVRYLGESTTVAQYLL